MTQKVLVDTNVILSAAIKFYVADLSLDVRHKFHDQSFKLMEKLKHRLQLQVGIVTHTVYDESLRVLVKAVLQQLEEEGGTDQEVRRTLLNLSATLVDVCQTNMESVLTCLTLESPNDADIQTNLLLVEDMCRTLWRIAQNYSNPAWVDSQVARRMAAPLFSTWTGPLRGVVTWVYREQVRREGIQLGRFSAHGPGTADKRILAEAISLLISYRAQNPSVEMFLASCDTGFFSPVRLTGGGISKPITDEIMRRFGIACDWPYAIAPQVR